MNVAPLSHAYSVAGVSFLSQFPVSALQALAAPSFHDPCVCIRRAEMDLEFATGRCIFDDRVVLGDAVYHLQAYWPQPRRCVVKAWRVSARGKKEVKGWQFLITADEICCQTTLDSRHAVDELLLLGPVMAVCLAMRGVFLLHASAVQVDDCLCVFLAESGVGKSTLAAVMNSEYGTQVADDIVSFRRDDTEVNGLVVDARFPQWKLPPDRQWRSRPGWRRVRWFFLKQSTTGRNGEPVLRALGQTRSLLMLLRHGVATRLFSAPVLIQHQRLCQRAIVAWPGFELHYQHSPRGLTDTMRSVVDHVRQGRGVEA